MKTSRLPSRYSFLESILALMAAFSALLAFIRPDWLELFGVDLDAGNGTLEWAVPVVLALIAVFFAVRAGLHWRADLARIVRARS